ncbi:hypothetical protein GW932_00165 [archaeon]|nr:hypothetical protein [archaeon]
MKNFEELKTKYLEKVMEITFSESSFNEKKELFSNLRKEASIEIKENKFSLLEYKELRAIIQEGVSEGNFKERVKLYGLRKFSDTAVYWEGELRSYDQVKTQPDIRLIGKKEIELLKRVYIDKNGKLHLWGETNWLNSEGEPFDSVRIGGIFLAFEIGNFKDRYKLCMATCGGWISDKYGNEEFVFIDFAKKEIIVYPFRGANPTKLFIGENGLLCIHDILLNKQNKKH